MAAGQGELDEYNRIFRQGGIGAGEGLNLVNLDIVGITDLRDWQIALGESRMLKAIEEFAETQFVWTNAKDKRCSYVVPTACATANIYPATIGDKARFDLCLGSTEDQRVKSEIRIDVAWRRKKRFKKLVAGAIWLGHGGLAPGIVFGGNGVGEGDW